ncbi:MAG TPA: GatB/YqeY domain-containing protein [Candidatus Saccharimonadales bacterium]|nr:GatB/YqeY domain-containing protein [Candidatus Saccharimonadales bacterium]
MQERIDGDLKAALLAGEKAKVETLRGLKGAILNEAIAQGVKDKGLDDEQIQKVMMKESKKRAEAADLYKKGGNSERAEAELAEKALIDAYLPEQADESQIAAAVDKAMAGIESPTMADMGKIIGAVKAELGAAADGSTVARIAKEKLAGQ